MDSDSGATVLNELRRYIHSNSVDRHTVRKFIDTVFAKTTSNDDANVVATDFQKRYREVALPIRDLVEQLDMPVSTLFILGQR